MRVIAIDGPAGSGKSTVARLVAEQLGLDYLDTGAMYRSVAFAALHRGIDPAAEDEVAAVAITVEIRVAGSVVVDGVDATVAIRSAEVTSAVSRVAANPEVRREMVRRQREWATAHNGGVIEGRDIGSVVFPDAALKVYLTASDEERARRRSVQEGGSDVGVVRADIARRDHVDSTRPTSPLAVANGATVIDTTGRSVDEVVREVLAHL